MPRSAQLWSEEKLKESLRYEDTYSSIGTQKPIQFFQVTLGPKIESVFSRMCFYHSVMLKVLQVNESRILQERIYFDDDNYFVP